MKPLLDVEALREQVLSELEDVRRDRVAFCVFHDDHGTPNMWLYDDHVYCYACNKYADYAFTLAKIRKPNDPYSILPEIYAEFGIAVTPEVLSNRLQLATAEPEYDDKLLVVSTDARLRRTAANFDQIEFELYLFDLDP
jgi:hypothetical protein